MNYDSYSNLKDALSHCMVHNRDTIIDDLKQKLYAEQIKNTKLRAQYESLVVFDDIDDTYYIDNIGHNQFWCPLCNKWIKYNCEDWGSSLKFKKNIINGYKLSCPKWCIECDNNNNILNSAHNKLKCSHWLRGVGCKWNYILYDILYNDNTNPLSDNNTYLIAALIIQSAYKRNWTIDYFTEIYTELDESDQSYTHIITESSNTDTESDESDEPYTHIITENSNEDTESYESDESDESDE